MHQSVDNKGNWKHPDVVLLSSNSAIMIYARPILLIRSAGDKAGAFEDPTLIHMATDALSKGFPGRIIAFGQTSYYATA